MQRRQVVVRVGHQYRLQNLSTRPELNGSLVVVSSLPDDSGRVLVTCGDAYYRPKLECLANPLDDMGFHSY